MVIARGLTLQSLQLPTLCDPMDALNYCTLGYIRVLSMKSLFLDCEPNNSHQRSITRARSVKMKLAHKAEQIGEALHIENMSELCVSFMAT